MATITNRKLRVYYYFVESGLSSVDRAHIETALGSYVCTVERCVGEGRKRFRRRVRSLQAALEAYPYPLLTTSREEV